MYKLAHELSLSHTHIFTVTLACRMIHDSLNVFYSTKSIQKGSEVRRTSDRQIVPSPSQSREGSAE
jgi:hypothetical protein